MPDSNKNSEKQPRRTILKTSVVAGSSLLLNGLVTSAAGAPTEIDECTTITEPGEYQLTSSLEAEGDCIIIDTADATLDGTDHTLQGDGTGVGIQIPSRNNFNNTIKNVTIRGFDEGIAVDSFITDITVKSTTVENNNSTGIYVDDWGELSLDACTIQQNGGSGITTRDWSGISVRDCEIQDNDDDAIFAGVSGQVRVVDSVIENNGGPLGISPVEGAETEIRNSEIRNNDGGGIRAIISDAPPESSPDLISNCEIQDNSGPGIEHNHGFLEIRNCTLLGNEIGYESSPGIYYSTILRNNNINDNDEYGALVEDLPWTEPIDAECNYWGHATGPEHEDNPRHNPKGQPVSDNVEFKPWSVREIRDDSCHEAPLLEYYTNENGVVEPPGLRDAIADWRDDVIETDLLRDVIDTWRSGEAVE